MTVLLYKVEIRGDLVTIYTKPPIDFDYPDPKNYTTVFTPFLIYTFSHLDRRALETGTLILVGKAD